MESTEKGHQFVLRTESNEPRHEVVNKGWLSKEGVMTPIAPNFKARARALLGNKPNPKWCQSRDTVSALT
jgi:hypothetical protein